ncbi:LCP family protein [Geodermatophilus sabuli]|uniref:Transcriptional attenuator, LytR family n=1 Tax=Geodermatophilus sabuli TaxID=1564158 RepID=A0A285EJV2_9ACTN|nr:LCP family protein [Geodermatophilus sabuli]MBB3086930.1 LCP family protein required for cell wall assembly [Geodermatophilus sabuli]SNX99290.1 transcriptional attenuator, LytR family [Geodermatophilus sabuli]
MSEWDQTRPIGPSRPLPPPPDGPVRTRRREERRFRSALGWTVLGAVVPGTAFLAAGRRVLGAVTLLLFLTLVGGGVWLATAGRRTAVQIAVDSAWLGWVLGGVVAVALLWVVVVVAGYRMLLPRPTSGPRHVLGVVVVLALVAAITYPAYTAVQVAAAHRGLLDELFADRESATVVDTPDPFGDEERVDVLLLGGDGGEGREGVRTDTVIVASIATDTGQTTLFSLPRNLQDLPFPADSPLAEAYPDGFEGSTESEGLLNAVYRNGPAAFPDILGRTDDPGADFLKLGVGEALGLDIDYFVLVNLDGFSRLVDALGGITVNVNYYVPINGDPGTGELPDDYIDPGPAQHMDGERALQFSRGRFGLTDYDRMARQRCTISAIIDAADPVTLLQRYQDLAATTQDIVSTDIPRSALDDFVDLGWLVKDTEVRSVVFDTSVIDPAYPDYDLMRGIVSDALAPPPPADDAPDGTPAPTDGAPDATPPPPGTPEGDAQAVTDVGDACAYDPVQAAEAVAAGEPPNKAD